MKYLYLWYLWFLYKHEKYNVMFAFDTYDFVLLHYYNDISYVYRFIWFLYMIYSISDFFENSHPRWNRYSLFEIGHLVWKANECCFARIMRDLNEKRFFSQRSEVFGSVQGDARSLKPLRKAWFELSPPKKNKAIRKGAILGWFDCLLNVLF